MWIKTQNGKAIYRVSGIELQGNSINGILDGTRENEKLATFEDQNRAREHFEAIAAQISKKASAYYEFTEKEEAEQASNPVADNAPLKGKP